MPVAGRAGARQPATAGRDLFIFERDALQLGSARGYADVFHRDSEGTAFWRGYSADAPDDAILARLLALNLQRAGAAEQAAATAAAVRPPRAPRKKTGSQPPGESAATHQ